VIGTGCIQTLLTPNRLLQVAHRTAFAGCGVAYVAAHLVHSHWVPGLCVRIVLLVGALFCVLLSIIATIAHDGCMRR